MKTSGSRTGFTLIEVLVVVIILAALASMVVVNLMDVPDMQKRRIVSVDLAEINTALAVYRLETGGYPRDLKELMVVPAGVAGRTEPYLGREARDPWDQPYKYKYPGAHNTGGYDIYSTGPNKLDDNGGNDDITNWKQEGARPGK